MAVVNHALELLGPHFFDGPVVALSLPVVLRTVRSFLEACPIDAMEIMATRQQLQSFAHRCRVALDGLQSFVLRNDPREDERLRIVGTEFSRGTFSLDQVASLLGLHPVDALVELEARGFARNVDAIRLSDEERKARLERIREDRLQRQGGASEFPQERIARDALASERIENVDARRWIPREVD